MEICPGLHLVERTRGSNVYLLVDDQMALIDTGMPGNVRTILDFIKRLGRDPEELAHIIITHGHFDHTGSLSKLRRITGAKVLAHSDEVARTRNGTYVVAPRMESPRGILVGVLARLGLFKSSPVDILLQDGGVLPYLGGLRVIHTPGHTNGSICLLLEERQVLFAGDTIINHADRLSRPLPLFTDKHRSEHSLLKVAALKFHTCCFGHGPPLSSSAYEKVKYMVANRPSSPLIWRILRNWRRLIRFVVGSWRRH